MREISTIKERILQYLDYKGDTKYKCYRKTGIANGVLTQKTGLGEENILRFISYYNDINLEWLLTGKGEMLKKEIEKQEENSSDKEIIEMQKQLLKSQNEQIELLKEKIANLQTDKRSSEELHK